MDVGDEHQQAGELLAAFDDAELRGLLDRVDGVAAGVGETDDLCLGGLGLQQEGREVGGVDGMAHLAQHLAARLGHDIGDVALQGVAEGVIGGEKNQLSPPALTTAEPVPLARAKVS